MALLSFQRVARIHKRHKLGATSDDFRITPPLECSQKTEVTQA